MVSERIIHRARLSKAFERGNAVWVWGIAGAGKSTLVHTHYGRQRKHARTHHLDRSDVDPVRFFARIAALFPKTRELQTSYPGLQSADPIVYARRFWARLWELAEPGTVLILEDHHELGGDHVALAILREAIASIESTRGQQLVVTSREPLPDDLSELALSGKLTLIDDAELRLDADEAHALTRSRCLSAESTLCDALYRRSRGWAACHQRLVAHVSAGGSLDDIPDSSTPHSLYEYLAHEVISKLAPEERSTLVATALLEKGTPRLIVQVTGELGSAAALNQLRHQGLVEVLEEDACLQVHPLLAAVSCKLASSDLGESAWLRLVARAAETLNRDARFDESMLLLLRYGLSSLASPWLKERAWSMLSAGRAHSLAGWLSDLPKALLERDLQLKFWQLVVSDATYQRIEHLQCAYRGLVAASDWIGAYSAWTWIANEMATGMERLLTAAWLDELDRLASLAPRPDSTSLDLHFERTLCLARVISDQEPLRFAQARQLIHALAREPANPAAICNLLWKAHYVLGIGEAAQLLLDVRAALRQRSTDALAALTLSLSEALVAVANGQHEQCIEQAMHSTAVCEELGMGHARLAAPALTLVVCALLAAGKVAGVVEAAARLASLPGDGGRFGELNRHFALGLADLRLGNLRSAASHLARAKEFAAACGCKESICHMVTGEAPIVEAMHGLQDARRLVDVELARCEEARLLGLRPTLYLLSTHVAIQDGQLEQAKAHAWLGLQAARLAGGLIPALDPRLLAETLSFALDHDIEPQSARWLVRTLHLEAPSGAGLRWPWRLEIRAFGGLVLSREGETLVAPTGKARELLCALVALGGRDVPLAVLSDMLWPDADGDAARRAFDTTLHRLRQHPSLKCLLELKTGRLSLLRAHVWVDVDAARGAASLGVKACRSEHKEILASASHAELLDGELDYPWLAAARSELRARVARAVQRAQ